MSAYFTYKAPAEIQRFHVFGELSSGPYESMALNEHGYPLYGVGKLCDWLWNNQGFPCLLLLTVTGGDVDASHALILAMRRHGECHTFGVGYVGSAGVDVLHCGKTRGNHPDTILMTHRGSKVTNRKLRELYDARDRKIYIDAPEILTHWHTIFSARDRHWSAEESRGQGFVQYVAEEPRIG